MKFFAALFCCASLAAQDLGPQPLPDAQRRLPGPELTWTIARIADNPQVRALFSGRGLDLLSLTWEDTGRSKNSCWGPNITDLTIQPVEATGAPLLPVIRMPNFSDTTADIALEKISVLVGNQRGQALTPITLRQYLAGFRDYQHAPTGYLKGSLLADRDVHALVSAQACLLPVPAGGSARFAPVLFSYQSAPSHPAVLAILVTPEGTSAQVIENNPQLSAGYAHGQRVFHNANGQRAGLLATRFSDTIARQAGQSAGERKQQADGLSCVLVIQVPLIVPEYRSMPAPVEESCAGGVASAPCKSADRSRGMEQAVVQAGPVEGPWLGLNGCTIERDTRFPIRVTVQFYQATDTAVVTSADVQRISSTIHRVYTDATAVGSLVTEGFTGRTTEPQVFAQPIVRPQPVWPQPWYAAPCRAYATATGRGWQDGLARVRERLGSDWQPASERELDNALRLVR